MDHKRFFKAFTLIEVLVVIAILGLLSSIILVAVNSARESGRIAAGKTFSSHLYQAYGATALAMYSFGGPAGTEDGSGNNNTLSFTGSVSFPGSPVKNGAGFPSLTMASTTLQTTPTSRYTVAGWIRRDINTTGVTVFFNSKFWPQLRITQSGSTYYFQVQANSPDTITVTNLPLAINKWYYFAVTYNGSAIVIYIDGVEYKRMLTSAPFTSNTVGIGAYNNGGYGGYACQCSLDEIAIYSESWTASEVFRHYSESAPKYLTYK